MRVAIILAALELVVVAALVSSIMHSTYGSGLFAFSFPLIAYGRFETMGYYYPSSGTSMVSSNATDFIGTFKVVRAVDNVTIHQDEILGAGRFTVKIPHRGVYRLVVESRYPRDVFVGVSFSSQRDIDMEEIREELGLLALLTPLMAVILWRGGRPERRSPQV